MKHMVREHWRFICHYKPSDIAGAQRLFDEICKQALSYRYSHDLLVPVGTKELTDALFGLTVQDRLKIFDKEIDGQTVKELLIASIYLKKLEALSPDQFLSVAVPFREESTDVAIFRSKTMKYRGNDAILPDEHTAAYLQIKEFFDFDRWKASHGKVLEPTEITPDDIKDRIHADEYSEIVLIYMRDFHHFDVKHFLEYFKQNKNVIIISNAREVEVSDADGKSKTIRGDGAYTFWLTYPGMTGEFMGFDKPSCLMTDREMMGM